MHFNAFILNAYFIYVSEFGISIIHFTVSKFRCIVCYYPGAVRSTSDFHKPKYGLFNLISTPRKAMKYWIS